jgi:hypothetical protein
VKKFVFDKSLFNEYTSTVLCCTLKNLVMYIALLMLLKVARLTRLVRDTRYLSVYDISIVIDFYPVTVRNELKSMCLLEHGNYFR